MTFSSPAKLNLFLKVVNKRPDGYHELASLFQTISLKDQLHITLQEQDQLTCTDPTIPTDGSNLVSKALHLFRKKTGVKCHVGIHLEKHIPAEAGLGGGSSNAATTLWALNQLTGTNLSNQDLMEMANEMGSDIAFFLSEGTAYCTGRGEIIKRQPPLKKNLWVIKPKEGLSTPLVYKHLQLDKLEKRDPEKVLKNFFLGNQEYFNDLEEPAFRLMPSLKLLRDNLLKKGFDVVVMSGSGSSLFCIGDVKAVVLEGIQAYPVHFLNRNSSQWYEA